jgi:hypothetical protein
MTKPSVFRFLFRRWAGAAHLISLWLRMECRVSMAFCLCRQENPTVSVRVVSVFIYSLLVSSPTNSVNLEAMTAYKYAGKLPLIGQHNWHRLQSPCTHFVCTPSDTSGIGRIKQVKTFHFSTPREGCNLAYSPATIRKTTNRRDMAISSTLHQGEV